MEKLTRQDLETYLNGISKQITHHKVANNGKPNLWEIKELNIMAEYAIYRFYNPDIPCSYEEFKGNRNEPTI